MSKHLDHVIGEERSLAGLCRAQRPVDPLQGLGDDRVLGDEGPA